MKDSIIKNKTTAHWFFSILAVFCFFLLWIIITTVQNDPIIYPKLSDILFKFFEIISSYQYLKAIFYDIMRITVVLLLSIASAFVVVFMYLLNDKTFYFINVFLKYFKTVPLVCIIVYLILIYPPQIRPLVITYISVVPIMIYGMIEGVKNIDKYLIDELRMLDVSLVVSYRDIYIPLLMPTFKMVLLQTCGLAIKVLITASFICYTPTSIGELLYNARANILVDEILAITLLLFLAIVLFEIILNRQRKKVNF